MQRQPKTHTRAMNWLLPIDQDWLMGKMTEAGYKINTKGICNGVTVAALQAACLEEEQTFFDRLLFIFELSNMIDFTNSIKEKRLSIIEEAKKVSLAQFEKFTIEEKNKLTETEPYQSYLKQEQFAQLKPKERIALLKPLYIRLQVEENLRKNCSSSEFEVLPFFDTIFTHQEPSSTSYLYPVGPAVHQKSVEIFSLTTPVKFKDKNICHIDSFSNPHLKPENFEVYLETFEHAHKDFNKSVHLFLSNGLHTIFISYNPKDKEWWFVNPSNLSLANPKKRMSRSELSRYVSHGLSGVTLISTHVYTYASSSEVNLAKQCVEKWKSNEKFKPLLEVDKKKSTIKNSQEKTWLQLAITNGETDVVIKLLNLQKKQIHFPSSCNNTALHIAVSYGYLEMSEKILELKFMNVNATNDDGETALIRAAYYGHYDIVKLLIEKGASINHEDGLQQTALYNAAQRGHLNILELLIKMGAKFHLDSKDTNTNPLLIAVANGHQNIVNYFIKKFPKLLSRDLLLLAAEHGQVEVLKQLIDMSEESGKNLFSDNIDEITKKGIHSTELPMIFWLIEKNKENSDNLTTIFHNLLKQKNTEPLSLLMAEGKFKFRYKKIFRALSLHIRKGHLAMVEFLINNLNLAQHKKFNPHTYLISACENNHASLANYFFTIIYDKKNNIKNIELVTTLQTALDEAAKHGNLIIAKNILSKIRDLSDQDQKTIKNNLLIEAIKAKQTHFFEKIITTMQFKHLDKGALINEIIDNGTLEMFKCMETLCIQNNKNIQYEGCFSAAQAANQLPIVKYLCKQMPSIFENDDLIEDAFIDIVRKDNTDLFHFLIKKDCQIDLTSENFKLLVFYAARNGNIDIMEELVHQKMSLKPFENRPSPLWIALLHGHIEVATLLIKYANLEDLHYTKFCKLNTLENCLSPERYEQIKNNKTNEKGEINTSILALAPPSVKAAIQERIAFLTVQPIPKPRSTRELKDTNKRKLSEVSQNYDTSEKKRSRIDPKNTVLGKGRENKSDWSNNSSTHFSSNATQKNSSSRNDPNGNKQKGTRQLR